MPTLTECTESIRELCKEKGHGNKLEDVPNKLLFAIVEIGEAVDIWKKNGFTKDNWKMGEELIDSIFYVLDAYGIMRRDLQRIGNSLPDPDTMFEYKLRKNLNREYKYGRPEE